MLDNNKGTERIYFVASRYPNPKIESLYETLSRARLNRDRRVERKTQAKMKRMFKSRGMGGVVETRQKVVSWEEQGDMFSILSKRLKGLCDSCANVFEFEHR